jgi:toxin ParE1/3/4
VNRKDVIPRARAEEDVNDALDFYLAKAGEKVAVGFIDALERAYRLIGERPDVGATRYAHELGLPGLRSWPLRGYPYVVFYAPREDHVDIWRVLYASSDLPAWMAGDDA